MNKIRLLTFLNAALVVMNIILLVLLFTRRPLKPPGKPPGSDQAEQVLIRELRLDEDQTLEFRRLRSEHMGQNEKINRDIHRSYDELYALLQSPTMDTIRKQALFESIEELTSALNHSNFDHFEALKSHLRQDQIPDFNRFTQNLKARFGSLTGNKRPPPRH